MFGSVILGTPAWEVETWFGSYDAIAAGEPDTVGDAVLQFTGDQPLSLSQYFGKRPEFLNKLRSSNSPGAVMPSVLSLVGNHRLNSGRTEPPETFLRTD
jgi:hypothetical protein